jgi:glycosyltransferase involved in cell wall biosynthesis
MRKCSFSLPIVYISNASWHYGLPTNRQQLPIRLAEHTKVLYSSPFSISQALLGQVQWQHYQPGIQEISQNLYLFHSARLLPMVRAQIWPFTWFDQQLSLQILKHQMHSLGIKRPILWFYYPPSFEYLIGRLGESLTCYHCTDDHRGYAEALGMEKRQVDKLAQLERQLVQTVNIVFTTSRPLYEDKVKLNPNTYLMPNVASVAHFAPVAEGRIPVAEELRDLPGPVAGFIGAVDTYKVDLPLIKQVAQDLFDWTFVFIGPIGSGDNTKPSDLPKLDNLHFLGPRPYSSLPSYIAGFDVCLIPYRLNGYTRGVFPLKLWEYLASGKPVVSTPLPALKDYEHYIEVGHDPDSFASALEKAYTMAKDVTARQQRLEMASGQSWERRAEEMIKILSTYL